MKYFYLGQSPEYTRQKMLESYDIEAKEREKAQEQPEGVPDTPQNPPDFAPRCPPGLPGEKDDE